MSAPVAYQYCTEQNLVYRVYHPAFYTRRSVRAACKKYHLVNQRCKLPPHPKKPYENYTGQNKGKSLERAAPPSTGGKIGGKKGKKNKRGKRGSRGTTRGTRLISI